LSQWAPGGRGPRCLAPAAPMVVTPLTRVYLLFQLKIMELWVSFRSKSSIRNQFV